ncbi:MAG: GntR family transcriptional regulator [Candidatus Delongbacteria bacterium]|nr:GntR family transcriptional regulator [Candidatus Delongbacteria bacterium]MCG2760923.1 GntR family transcriptional regulator [Candidatus Delongbacteria bacterium]
MSENKEIYFQIQPSSGVPIYKQIVDQVERLVASGSLSPGDEMPSVRRVATHFEVNPMTVSKAYSMLESSNILERRRGMGMFVASNSENAKSVKQRIELIKPVLEDVVEQAKQLGLPNEKVIELLKKLLENNDGK